MIRLRSCTSQSSSTSRLSRLLATHFSQICFSQGKLRGWTPERKDTNPARQVKIEAGEAAAEATREAGRLCRRARGEKSPQSIGRNGPRIRPRDDGVYAHPAESPPGSRPRMSWPTVGWFLNNMHRAFASMDDQELNRVSETLNTEMDQRVGAEPDGPRGCNHSRVGRDRSRPPPGGDTTEADANEPGSRARSRSKAVTRRRAQWRFDHGLPPQQANMTKNALF